MTSNVELLPLPGLPNIGAGGQWLGWSDDDMRDYALANVLHHTAPLRYALDNAARSIKSLRGVMDSHAAEIVALRAEVRTLVRQNGEWQARVERLAEALRDMIELREATQRGEVHPTRHELDIVKDARALLHPTAAQEDGRD